MSFVAMFALAKSLAPVIALIASTVAAVAHTVLAIQHKKDHALLVDQVAEIAAKAAGAVSPAPQVAAPDASSSGA